MCQSTHVEKGDKCLTSASSRTHAVLLSRFRIGHDNTVLGFHRYDFRNELLRSADAGSAIEEWRHLESCGTCSSFFYLGEPLPITLHICLPQPCTSINWELQVNFKVHGKGKDLYGDGFALWYSRDRLQTGPVFGSKDNFMGLAIILDTYSNHNGPHNHQHPYISAMVNNGSLSYDHDRDGTHTQIAGCEAKFRNVEFDTQINIRYENDVLTVFTDLENKATWKECFRVEGVKLPTGYYFGASATTGDLSDNHDIISIKFFELEAPSLLAEDRRQIVPSAATFEAPREHKDDPKPGMSNVKIFFLILLSMLIVVVLVVIGIMFYQKHQENARKRFY